MHTIKPQKASLLKTQQIPVYLKHLSNTSIKVYPNPITDGLIYIKSNNSDEAITYSISNTMGQVFSLWNVLQTNLLMLAV